MRRATRGFLVAAFVGISVITAAIASDRPESNKSIRVEERVDNEAVTVELSSSDTTVDGELVPLPANAVFRRTTTGAGETEGSAAAVAGSLVYSNTLGAFVLGPAAGFRIADDITTVGDGSCELDHFVFKVTGDKDNDPDIDEGPFTVDYALFRTCPGAEICQPFESICPRPIGGTSGQITLPDEGFWEVTIEIPDLVCAGGIHDGRACALPSDCFPTCQGGSLPGAPCSSIADCPDGFCDTQLVGVCSAGVELPSSFYLAVTFSRQQVGIVVGAPPLKGVSSDRYDSTSFPCASGFGGFPAAPHASFYAEFYVKEPCDTIFPAYRNTRQSERPFSPGAFKLFADDITLGVDASECNMVAYEAAFKGSISSSQGAVRIELFSRLDDADPEDAGRIPFTRVQAQIFGNDVQIVRRTFDPPIPLANYIGSTNRLLWAMYKTTSRAVGPIRTCSQADPGSTLDLYFQYVGALEPPDGNWLPFTFGSCLAAFELTIFCEGEAPDGACCDILLQEDQACVGGSFPDTPCRVDDDCMCEPACEDGTCPNFACVGGPIPGDFCLVDTDCTCPTLTCRVVDLGGSPVCDGGPNDGTPCVNNAACDFSTPCTIDGWCVGEAVCRQVAEVNCATTVAARWVEGEHCGPVCLGGSNHGNDCLTDADCPSSCFGGDNDGLFCDPDGPCPGGTCDLGTELCIGGTRDGVTCDPDGPCPGGLCDVGTCEGSFCFEGVNDGLACTRQADCPGGSCEDQPFLSARACGIGSCCGCFGGPCGTEAVAECDNVTERECFEETPDGARLYFPGGSCATTRCPWAACLDQKGLCTLPREHFCVGGENDGEPCDSNAFLAYECPPGYPSTSCPLDPGCEDPVCCTKVCNVDAYCCNTDWDPFCAATAAAVCTDPPENDKCVDAVFAALPLSFSEVDLLHSQTESDEPGFCCLSADPGGPGEGGAWFKFVSQAICDGGDNNGLGCRGPSDCPDGTCPDTTSVSVSTCNSVGRVIEGTFYPADDSILQIFSVADPDLGVCGDLSTVCSVSAQDCIDGSTCQISNQRACSVLIPIACDDNFGEGCPAPGGGTQPNNSRLCIPNTIVGQTYFVMVSAALPTTKHCEGGTDNNDPCTANSQCRGSCVSGPNAREQCSASNDTDCLHPRCDGGGNNLDPCATSADCADGAVCTCCPQSFCDDGLCVDDEHRGVYAFTVTSPCGGAIDLIPNDLCDDGEPITGTSLTIPFDLSGGADFDAVTFDCPGPSCNNPNYSLRNDVWYDWIAPANGKVEVDTCAGFGSITPDTSMVIYDGCDCPVDVLDEMDCSDFEVGGDCFAGSRIGFNAVKGQCYKIRLGGRLGATNVAGDLHLEMTECPNEPVTFDDPEDGTVDARQPHPPTDPATSQLIQQFTVTAPQGVNIVDRLGSRGRFTCWKVCESALDASLTPNRITNITDNFDETFGCSGSDSVDCVDDGDCVGFGGSCVSREDGTFKVRLLRPITAEAVTTITYTSGDDSQISKGVFTSHPGNADGLSVADVGDLVALMDYLTGSVAPPWGLYSSDIDHSGMMTPADILRLIDILEGAHSLKAMEDSLLPPCGSICCPLP